jgi:hypothetical protein
LCCLAACFGIRAIVRAGLPSNALSLLASLSILITLWITTAAWFALAARFFPAMPAEPLAGLLLEASAPAGASRLTGSKNFFMQYPERQNEFLM